ncbi:bifunctional cobalt-precorrin-7 (C(5))-methyltransferase/cobalt-precorrin-6B (C(15))-methyltransferase [Salinispora tropica]|uniref:Precorrin-6Y C5,15-methyltransferase (Decarboxylating) n=1 Tax=Salinispora tropica (strain ATCC BAA-916 / DSM 44818 / JCM 13857 / NBRC 105044 / CNB-440) TaxID=369723 RepID=A4X7W6_SALTO|nr:bifunctional cobalt-precorrin-7 (C(5))-methyltransferase/cobalt-precorrin-6B (C(15))-methyltransferase [Salinispora tropica]ABP54966.1 precorrin-6Y C5,15-methyltransferase (decarboxylating) [Salinispora tropica CNB-440]
MTGTSGDGRRNTSADVAGDSVVVGATAVTVAGVDAAGNPTHPALAAELVRAGLVVGAARHLTAAPVRAGTETVVLGPLSPALERLAAAVAAGTPAVVLASGDPGCFGIVRRLRVAGLPVRVLPAVSSIAAAFARAGLSWDGAAVVSAHGRDAREALNACRALPLVAVLTAPGAGAAELGAGLAGWSRRLMVAEHLGTDAERITWTTPAEAAAGSWTDPHVLLSLAPGPIGAARVDNQPAAAPAGGWALPEGAYRHRDSMITKAEVRALVVAGLRPRLGRLVWDVGAGSGSVGIECALLGAAVVAVERDSAAVDLVRGNAARHGVDVRVVPGAAPAALDGLPDPDAVFVGGGGTGVLAAVAARQPGRIVVALAALDRVAPARDALRAAGYTVEGVQLSAARLADLPGGSIRLAATNPVVVLTGERL